MDFSANKQDTYEKRIASLPDQPNMQPDELKAYFDSSPEQLRQAHNGLCDALSANTAAASLGFQRTAGVPADNVQAAVENVQAQLDAAVMGNIPSGSVTQDKLAQDVRDRFTAIENTAKSEASTRANADTALSSRISAAEAALTRKCEIQLGSYMGNGTEYRDVTQTIVLGYQPLAVIVSGGRAVYGDGSEHPHDIAMPGLDSVFTTIVSNGFTVTGWMNMKAWLKPYRYIAFKPV